MTDLNDFPIKHLIFFWHACNRSETHLEDDISASVLDVSIPNLPVFLLIVLAQQKNDISVLWVASAHKGLLNPEEITVLIKNMTSMTTYFDLIRFLRSLPSSIGSSLIIVLM